MCVSVLRRGYTPLMIAAQAAFRKTSIHQSTPDSSTIASLIALGADKKITNNQGITALGCFYKTTRDHNDFYSVFPGVGSLLQVDPTLEKMLMPSSGPTAADMEVRDELDDFDDFELAVRVNEH